MQLMSFFTLVAGLTPEEARSRIYYIDSQGLITSDRAGLAEHKKCMSSPCHGSARRRPTDDLLVFARTDCPPLKDLVDIIGYVKPTALLGLSTIKVSRCPVVHFRPMG